MEHTATIVNGTLWAICGAVIGLLLVLVIKGDCDVA